MTARTYKPIDTQEDAELSPLMQAAVEALGGTKHWAGSVRGLAGLICRTFIIHSTGHLEDEQLKFSETLKFDNGDVNQREWRIFERPEGLHIESESVVLIRPGQLKNSMLSFVYRLNLGQFSLLYHDTFKPGPNGKIENTGFATFLGLRIMTIDAEGRVAK